MTNNQHGQVPEAMRLADWLDGCVGLTSKSAAAELRRLHAYCQELESQVIRDCMTHVQKPAEIEHVAGDVLKNEMGSNMSTQPVAQQGAAYAALPEPLEIDWPELHSQALGCGVEDRGLHSRYECAEYGWQDGVDKCAERVPEQIFDADQMRAFADATHALRTQPVAQQTPPTKEVRQGAYETGWKDGYKHGAWSTQQPAPAPMSPTNRLVAYSAATRLRELGFEWDATAEAWLQPAPATQQAGWRLVPIEPTQAMLDAMQSGGWMVGNYRDMLAAAPQQEAQEPAAVVVPCHAPSGKRVALYSAKQDLPIGTKLYTGPQPSPTAQAAESVLEEAARYRWLREGNDAKHGAARHIAVNLYGCEWDAAIDAARAAQKEGKQ